MIAIVEPRLVVAGVGDWILVPWLTTPRGT
jgi:hypothetical protein